MKRNQKLKMYSLARLWRFSRTFALTAAAVGLCLPVSVHAQAVLLDVGAGNPAAGADDIAQLSTASSFPGTNPDGLNYFWDNVPCPGQTFTTGSNPSGYALSSLALKTMVGDGGDWNQFNPFALHLYSVSGSTATLISTYTVSGFVLAAEGDWVEWKNLTNHLAPSTQYAFSLQRLPSGSGWEPLGAVDNNAYAGGELALIPVDGGAMTFGSSHAWDAAFIVGFAPVAPTGPGGTTIGIQFAGDGSRPVAARAFGVNVADWSVQNNGTGGPNSINGGVTVQWTASGTWYNSAVTSDAGDNDLYSHYLDDGGSGNHVAISGLNRVFPNGYIVQTAGSANDSATRLGPVSIASGAQTLTYPTAQSLQGGGVGLSTPSPTLNLDAITIDGGRNLWNGGPAGVRASLSGIILTDKPLIQGQPQQPASGIYVSQTFTLSLTAIGVAPLHYQWRKNGVDIPGATGTSYTKSGASTADSANYDAVVTNPYGSVNSSAVLINVNNYTLPANIVISPSTDQTRLVGGAAVFTVSSDGIAPFTYQWKKAGAPLAGATNVTLVLSSLSLGDAGSYSCTVRNSYGPAESPSVQLSVQTGPPATVGLNFGYIGALSSQEVTVPAFGVDVADWSNLWGPHSSQTILAGNGSLLVAWDAPNAWFNNHLSNEATTGEDQVLYGYLDDGWWQDANGVWHVSNAVTISGLNSVFPVYVVQTLASSDNAGGFMEVTITNDSQALSYPVMSPQLTALSTVSSPLQEDTIKIQGMPWTGVKRGSLAGIIITDKPVISKQPQAPAGTNYIGNPFSLSGLNVVGVPPLTYQWRKAGVNLAWATNAAFDKPSSTELDGGNYDVVVQNAYGSATSSIVAVSFVSAMPFNLAVTPLSQTRYAGWSATFSIAAEGSQPFTYQWKKGGSPLAGATASTLTLSAVSLSDSGDYSCTVGNVAGSVSSTIATLNVVSAVGYASQIAMDQPLALYRFTEAAGAINSGSSGAAGNGVYTAGASHGMPGALAGNSDTAAGFGTNSTLTGEPVLIPNRPELNTVHFTAEAWVYPTYEGIANAGAPLMNRVTSDGAGGRQGWVFFQRDANGQTTATGNGSGFNFRMYQPGTSSASVNITGGSYNVNAWTHLAATYDGATARLYVNGVEVASAATTSYAPNTLQPFAVGAYSEKDGSGLYQNPFFGSVDEVALYATTLTASQIAAHYANGINASRTTPYKTLIQADGAVEYLQLNEPEAVAFNSGTVGAVADGVYKLVGDSAGLRAPAYAGFESNNLAKSFDGISSYVDLGNPAELNFTGQITLEAWIQPSSTQSGLADVIAHGVNGAGDAEVMLRLTDAGNPGARYQVGAWTTNNAGTSYNIPAEDYGTWVHLVGTYDGANWNLYRNGALVASEPNSRGSVLVNDAPWAIGARGAASRPFKGNIDEVAIYNVALSADRILAHYNMGRSGTVMLTPPTLGISNSWGAVSVSWSAGTLQESTNVTGPYVDVSGATSPYVVPVGAKQKFYRAHR